MELIKKVRFNSKKFKSVFLPVILLIFTAVACKISYSFSGASISSQVKTMSVERFFSRVPLVPPGLDQTFTDALIDMCRSKTSLRSVSESGDVEFEGEITEYQTLPRTVSGDDNFAATNRFTITVRVKFTNSIEPEYNFDQSFSHYVDYDGERDFTSVERDLSESIVDKIIEDIFNKAFVNW